MIDDDFDDVISFRWWEHTLYVVVTILSGTFLGTIALGLLVLWIKYVLSPIFQFLTTL